MRSNIFTQDQVKEEITAEHLCAHTEHFYGTLRREHSEIMAEFAESIYLHHNMSTDKVSFPVDVIKQFQDRLYALMDE